jgi:hypothetical protein
MKGRPPILFLTALRRFARLFKPSLPGDSIPAHIFPHVNPVPVHGSQPVSSNPIRVRHSPSLGTQTGFGPPEGIGLFQAIVERVSPAPIGHIVPQPFLLTNRVAASPLFGPPVLGRLELLMAIDTDHLRLLPLLMASQTAPPGIEPGFQR